MLTRRCDTGPRSKQRESGFTITLSPETTLTGHIDILLTQLEVGIPADALDLLWLPLPLARGE